MKALHAHLYPHKEMIQSEKTCCQVWRQKFWHRKSAPKWLLCILLKFFSISILGSNGIHQDTVKSWVCCNVLPDWWTGNCPSLSKCYCNVKTAARRFPGSLITVAGRWVWKDKMLFLNKISKWNFTNVHSHPPCLLCCQQAAKKPARLFLRLSFH